MATKEKEAVSNIDDLLDDIKALYNKTHSRKLLQRLSDILTCEGLDESAAANGMSQRLDKRKMHPVRPKRGELYYATITTGVGTELSGRHPVIVIQNDKGNLYASKVIVVAVEGDGSRINTAYNMQLLGANLKEGKLDKDPSRIIVSEILTIDKTRLENRMGKLDDTTMNRLEAEIKKQICLK